MVGLLEPVEYLLTSKYREIPDRVCNSENFGELGFLAPTLPAKKSMRLWMCFTLTAKVYILSERRTLSPALLEAACSGPGAPCKLDQRLCILCPDDTGSHRLAQGPEPSRVRRPQNHNAIGDSYSRGLSGSLQATVPRQQLVTKV